MKANIQGLGSGSRHAIRQIGGVVLSLSVLVLSACGGDGSSSGVASIAASADRPLTDTIAYSTTANASLRASQAVESAAVMHRQWTGGGTTVNYTSTTGHLIATDPSGKQEATMSYVAYTAPSQNGAPRPVTFFYNGGPGSSSVWLRLGSFAPTRVATPDPLLTNWPNFPLVSNDESLIGTTDMVFIDPPGTGLSEAIAPNTNKTFWTTDSDVRVMRDFIRRYVAANGRSNSPLYLYGESYGTPRTDMLALSLESAGVNLTGIVLQSSILNYFADPGETYAITNGNSSSTALELKYTTDGMIGYFLGYAEVAAYFNQVSPAPTNLGTFALQIQNFVTAQYSQLAQYAPTFFFAGSSLVPNPKFPDNTTLSNWSTQTNLSIASLNAYFGNDYYGTSLVPGSTIGRYDGRVILPSSDPRLAQDSDPSDILITQPFTNTLATQLPNELGYSAPNATYATLNDSIIGVWDFSHAGQVVPDTIPDLLAALRLNPQLKVLSANGYHDLATPFFLTENQLARLQTVPGLQVNLQMTFYQGGHMIYLDNVARPQLRSDLVSFFANQSIPNALSLAQLPAPWPDETPAGTPTLNAAAIAAR
ncbi:peptidase S10 [Burkholderia plantarii]|uniref:S10 family serine carboxypeptidase-like protein n=1 Tax=Burkholderia plantarii TaxID=41899 RepID=UPI00272A4C85|nr:peptidase S10 [Burkholderia plantarii]WLE58766.1 peptidase S10 [Burkholderia plantarii]